MDRIAERLNEGRPLRVPELAGLIGVSRSYLYKLISNDKLRVSRVGSDYSIPIQEARRLAREVGALEG